MLSWLVSGKSFSGELKFLDQAGKWQSQGMRAQGAGFNLLFPQCQTIHNYCSTEVKLPCTAVYSWLLLFNWAKCHSKAIATNLAHFLNGCIAFCYMGVSLTLFFPFFFMACLFCLCAVCRCTSCVLSARRGQERVSDPWGYIFRQLRAAVWVLRTESRSSARWTSALNWWTTSPAPFPLLYFMFFESFILSLLHALSFETGSHCV